MFLFPKKLQSAIRINDIKTGNYIFCVLLLLIEAGFLCSKAHAQCSSIDFKASVTKGCPPLIVKFTAIGTSSSAGTTFQWDFGKGFINGVDSITTVFTTQGQYTIKMKATLSGSSSPCPVIEKDTFITVYPVPNPDFYTIPDSFYCAPGLATFINTTTNSDSGSEFRWDFGDGTSFDVSDTEPMPHVYEHFNKNQYAISLTAISSYGCSETITKTAITILGPIPMFTMDKRTGCDSLTVHFTNTSKNVKKFYFLNDDGSPPDSVSLAPHKYVLSDPNLDSIFFYPTLQSLDDSTCRDYFRDTIKLYRNCTNGIALAGSIQFDFSVYPNPFQSSITVQYNLVKASKITLSLFDITGRQIGTIINENQLPGTYRFDIDAEKYKLIPGVYVLKFMAGDDVVSRQLVKF